MRCRWTISITCIATLWCAGQPSRAVDEPAGGRDKPVVWTLDEALEQLHRCPRDPFLQYVALQLAWRAGNAATVQGPLVEAITGASPVRGRLASADLFSLFTGALAVQESLQLDAMSGPGGQRTPGGLLPEENRETVQVTSLIGPTI